MDVFSAIVGAAVGAGVGYWLGRSSAPAGAPAGSGTKPTAAASHASGATLNGRIVPNLALGSPAPALLIPQGGYASRDDYQWSYLVGPGDSAGGIAEAIVGDDGRYQELLLANPAAPTVGKSGTYLGDHAWDFDPNWMTEGRSLLLPVPWSRYVDETGRPAGSTTPFPRDGRAPLLSSAAPKTPAFLTPGKAAA